MADLIDRRRGTGWRLVLGLTLCVVGAAVPTRGFGASHFQSGNSLLAYHDSKNLSEQGIALGYIVGISDVLEGHAINGWRACSPANGVTQGQVRDVVVQWLRAHPEKRHFGADGLVAEALQTAFPCKR